MILLSHEACCLCIICFTLLQGLKPCLLFALSQKVRHPIAEILLLLLIEAIRAHVSVLAGAGSLFFLKSMGVDEAFDYL